MNFDSIEDIINFASQKEQEAVKFYIDLSQQEPFQTQKELLVDFAKQEQKHYELLQNFLENRSVLDSYTFKWIPDLKRSDYIVDIEYSKGMSYRELLMLAMKREEKALKLYNDLLVKIDIDEFKKLFKTLSQEEAKHKNILETIYDDHMAEQGD